jgi:hypothetical protein
VKKSGRLQALVQKQGPFSQCKTFRSLLTYKTLVDIGYTPTKADPDVWFRPAVKTNGFEYYVLALCYVDKIHAISDNLLKATLLDLTSVFKLKYDKIEPPDVYLGAHLAKMFVGDAEC